jgi:hypothetical protein
MAKQREWKPMKNEWQLTLPSVIVTFPEPVSEQEAMTQLVHRLGVRMPSEPQSGLMAYVENIRSIEVCWPDRTEAE